MSLHRRDIYPGCLLFAAIALAVLWMLCFLFTGTCWGAERPVSPNDVCRGVIAEQLRHQEEDRPFMVWLALNGPDEAVERQLLDWVWHWWSTQLTLERIPVYPRRVVLAGGTPALEFDRRDLRWTDEAWEAIASRHPYFNEFSVDADTLKIMNGLAGSKETKFAVPVVRADWLFRATAVTKDDPAYYDLLFGEQRYVRSRGVTSPVYSTQDEVIEIRHTGGYIHWPDGTGRRSKTPHPPGEYTITVQKRVKVADGGERFDRVQFVDFPRNIKDAEKLFGVTASRDFAAEFRLDVAGLSVVAGSRDSRKGSFVALNNRVLEWNKTPNGVSARSYDATSSSGKFDFLQNSDQVAKGKFEFEGGESLYMLPNGGIASLLTAGANEDRIEVAQGDFVHNFREYEISDFPLSVVSNPLACVACHASEGGWIQPRNLVEEFRKKGGRAPLFDDVAAERQYKALFRAQAREIEGYRAPYRALMNEALGEAGAVNSKGELWTAVDLVKAAFAVRDDYDEPLSPEQQARELGVDVKLYQDVMSESDRIHLGNAALGGDISREKWEDTEFTEAARFLNARLNTRRRR